MGVENSPAWQADEFDIDWLENEHANELRDEKELRERLLRDAPIPGTQESGPNSSRTVEP